jgi:HTH-type transcriptional regulator, competence development regulator
MLTDLGKELRRLRIQREMTLRAMASMLNLSPAFVSAVETGKKSVPEQFVTDVVRVLRLSGAEKQLLEAVIGRARSSVTVKLKEKDTATVQLALSFARRFPELTEDQKRLIQEILDDRDNSNLESCEWNPTAMKP